MIPDPIQPEDVAIWIVCGSIIIGVAIYGGVELAVRWWARHKRVRAREEQAEAVRAAEFGGLR